MRHMVCEAFAKNGNSVLYRCLSLSSSQTLFYISIHLSPSSHTKSTTNRSQNLVKAQTEVIMWSFKKIYAATIACELLLSVAILAIEGVLLHRTNQHCFAYTEAWMVAAGCLCTCLCIFGCVCIAKNCTRAISFYIVFSCLLSVGLVVILVFFWTLAGATHSSSEHWWRSRFIRDAGRWDNIRGCYLKTSFCARGGSVGCCQQPPNCKNGTSVDCVLWDGANCYMCSSCMAATFYRLRSDSRRLGGPLTFFVTLFVLVAFYQIYVWWNARNQQTTPNKAVELEDLYLH